MPLHISLAAETLFTIFGFPVTNTLFTAWIVVAFLCVGAFFIKKIFSPKLSSVSASNGGATFSPQTVTKIPSRFAVFLEIIMDGLLGFFTTVTGSEESARKFFPLVATIFFFVLFANWFGVFPGMGTISIKEIIGGKAEVLPIFRTVFSDLNMTITIALVSVVMSHVFGLRHFGKGHIGKYISFKSPIAFFVGILEVVSEFAKVISFSFRLFGNIFAGEVLIVVVSSLIPVIIPLPFMGLELFVGLIQALIFAVLTLVFFASADESHEPSEV